MRTAGGGVERSNSARASSTGSVAYFVPAPAPALLEGAVVHDRIIPSTISESGSPDCLEGQPEGIRARIIDKDNKPQWRFARIEDVTRADVEKMFDSPWPANEHPLRDLQG